MSQSNPLLVKSRLADNAVQPYRFVKMTSTGVDVATAGTDIIDGVFQGPVACATGDTIAVVTDGTAVITASAAISKGAYVTATTAGKAVATTTAGNVVRGIAQEAAAADGDRIEIALRFFHHHA